MRAARAEVGRAGGEGKQRHARAGEAAAAPRVHGGEAGQVAEPPGERAGDEVGVELAAGRDQRRAGRVGLPGDPRRPGRAVQDLLEGRLDERPFLLHHDDLIQPEGEVGDLGRNERVDHPQAHQPHSAAAQLLFAEAHDLQRVAHVQVRLARRDDADTRRGAEILDRVQLIGARVGPGHLHPDALAARFHLRQGGLQHPGRQLMLESPAVQLDAGFVRLDPLDADVHGSDPVGHVGGDLQRYPQPAGPRHRHRVHAHIEDILRVGRVQHGHPEVREQVFRGSRDGG